MNYLPTPHADPANRKNVAGVVQQHAIVEGHSPFLTAQWRHLAMLNFEIEPDVLAPYVPTGTELDEWNGKTLISVVGFRFLETRILGWSIPFHRSFDEVNLRFYVRRISAEGWRRGVVFIKELAPRRAVAWVARAFYGENYSVVPVTFKMLQSRGASAKDMMVSYGWQSSGDRGSLSVSVRGGSREIQSGSEEEFVIEHYWGYTRFRRGQTMEYQISHLPWRVWTAHEARLDCDIPRLYGDSFARCLSANPTSAFLVDGSEVTVFKGRSLALESEGAASPVDSGGCALKL